MLDYLIAIAAPLVNSVQMLPQLYKAYDTQSVRDLSLFSLLLILLTNLLWFVHGYFQMDWSLLVSGGISLLINGALLGLYLWFEGKKQS